MTTRLDIINAMLASNGEAPVSSHDSIDPSAIQASNALNRVDRKVQARGWYFNRETIELSPNLIGEVVLPQNTLSADPVDTSSQYIKRGSSLYDRYNNTRNIGETVKCILVLQLDIEDLPELAASYIEAKAVKEYYEDDDGDESKARRLDNRESEAYAFLQRENLAAEDVNIRNTQLGSRLLRETRRGITYIDRGA